MRLSNAGGYRTADLNDSCQADLTILFVEVVLRMFMTMLQAGGTPEACKMLYPLLA